MRTFAYILASVALAGFVATEAHAKPAPSVDCDAARYNSIQSAVDAAAPGDTVFISGTCVEDVSITKDDITLSGNEAGVMCDKASPGGTGEIDGTVTVDGVRARIEFLTITGSGEGVVIINRADARLTCNDISGNEAEGVGVVRSSNAVLRDNTLSGNGTRAENPFIFFDCGLFVADASSVNSKGNTYEDNQYCAIEVDRQSSFKNGAFLPREPGHEPDLNEKDVITQRPGINQVAIEVFNGGLVDLRNADVTGLIEISALSSFRVDGEVDIVGDIGAQSGSVVRVKNRNAQFVDRQVTFAGTLLCTGNSQVYSSSVSCGQTCTGIIGGDTGTNTCTP